MSDATVVASPPSTPAPRLRPLWARAAALVTSPRSVFEELAARPAWFWTTAFLAVWGLVLFLILWEPVFQPYQLDRAEQKGMSSEQIARMEQMYAMPQAKIGIAAFAACANIVFVVVIGLALYGLCTFLLGGRATVKQSLSVSAHAGLVHLPRSLLALPLMFARQDPTVTLGPGALFPVSEASGFAGHFLAAFLSGFDLFYLWSLALTVLGMSVVSRLPTRQVAIALSVTYVALQVLFALIGAVFNR